MCMGGLQGAWNRIRLDRNQQPRLSAAYEKILGVCISLSMGGRVDSLRVVVKGKSNREIAKGNLESLDVTFGQVRGPLFQARQGSLLGSNLSLGLRPVLTLSYPILLLLGPLPGLWLTLGAILLWSISKPKSAVLSYSLGVAQQDLLGCLVFRTILQLSLDTLMKSSVLGAALSAATGDLNGALASATGFEVRGVEVDERKRLVFDAEALLPEGAVFSFQLRTAVTAEQEGLAFVNPEIFVSPGWPLPDFWLPVISGAVLALGKWNRVQHISPRLNGLDVKGSLLLGTDDLPPEPDSSPGSTPGRARRNRALPPSK